MRSFVSILALAAALSLPALPLPAAELKKTTIKLGTLAPTGTSYHKQLLLLRDQWAKASGGALQLVIYPDGRQGSESEMVSAMATGNLHAGLLTASGLAQIEPSVTALQSMPMTFRTLAEVDYVTEKMRPLLEAKLAAKGFMVLFWTDSGWVRIFSKRPVEKPDDLKKLRVFSWAGGQGEFEAWKAGGFNPVSLEPSEIFSSLGTGIITACPMPPFFALAAQIDNVAPHMLDLNWAPLVGAIVISKATWNKIPPPLQADCMTIAEAVGREVKTRARAEATESVRAMQKRKLTVHPVSAEVQALWESAADQIRDRVRGPIVPAEFFDAVRGHLTEYRASNAAR
ncbi:MAG: TRAP transporter substrate-binding protein DctP [Verrucomicrobia bacterium]|nr:TRAP transporter substrate-binding protein DctP [Verrucomicrobiota bacterium]MBI3868752.1 TRAP transporter substrate-binding protein DctP [Verrucomicrobiota bacterium]